MPSEEQPEVRDEAAIERMVRSLRPTRHFAEDVLRRHPEAGRMDWIAQVLLYPVEQAPGRGAAIVHWGYIAEAGKYLRVVTGQDRSTLVTAHFDQDFRRRSRRRAP